MTLIKIISKNKVKVFPTLVEVSDTDFNSSNPIIDKLKETYVSVCVDSSQIDMINLSKPVVSHRMLVNVVGDNINFKHYSDKFFLIPKETIDYVESLPIKKTKEKGFKKNFLLKFNSIGNKIAFGVKPNEWLLESDWRRDVLPNDPDYKEVVNDLETDINAIT